MVVKIVLILTIALISVYMAGSLVNVSHDLKVGKGKEAVIFTVWAIFHLVLIVALSYITCHIV